MDLLFGALNILIFVVGFGVLIFVHELGHFVAAKWAGIRTEAFAVGFGHPVVSWRKGVGFSVGSSNAKVVRRTGRTPRELTDQELEERGIGETEYSLRWLPLGGFVRMLGQDDLAPAAREGGERSFNSAAIWKRMIVVSAGVIMNLIFAAILFVIAFTVGVRFEAPVIGSVAPASPASLARGLASAESLVGLQPGDRIVTVDGDDIETFMEAQIAIAMAVPDTPMIFGVERSGHDDPLLFSTTPIKNETSGLLSVGISPASSNRLAGGESDEAYEIIAQYLQRDDLWAQGLRPGMEVIACGGQPVSSLDQFQERFSQSDGESVSATWSQGNTTVEISMKPQPKWPILGVAGGREMFPGLLGLSPLVSIEAVSPDSPNQGILKPRDAVLSLGDVIAPRMTLFRETIAQRGPGPLPMVVLRDGEMQSVEAVITDSGVLERKPILGVAPGYAWSTMRTAQPVVALECDATNDGTLQVVSSPVASAGIMPGSRIVAVNGEAVEDWVSFIRMVGAASGASVSLEVENPTPQRERRVVSIPLEADACSARGALSWECELPSQWFAPIYTTRSSGGNPLTAIAMGATETVNLIVMTYLTLDRVARGSVGVEQLQGPVGIVHIGTKVVDRGFMYVLFFLALISVNLAVVNFLPLPIVDGGLFLNLIYEKIRGRPPSPGFQNTAAILGLILIGTVFLMVTYNDIVRLVG